MAITWKQYGALAAASAGIFLGGPLWWLRQSPVIRGHDLAECVAAYAERYIIGLHTGTNAPALSLPGFETINTNFFATNFTSVVTLSAAAGVNVGRLRIASGATNTFDSALWPQTFYVTWATNATGGSGDATKYYDIKVDGEQVGQVYVVQVASGSPYVEIGGTITNLGVVYAPDLGVQLPPESLGDNTFSFQLNAAPTTTAYVVTNSVYGVKAVDDYLRWTNLYAMLGGMRATALTVKGDAEDGYVMWTRTPCQQWNATNMVLSIPTVMTNFDTVYTEYGRSWTQRWWYATENAIGATDYVNTVAARWAGMTVQSGYSVTNTPFWNAVDGWMLFSSLPDVDASVQATGAWWPSLGFNGTSYVWRCETATTNATPSYTNLVKWITTNNLNDARAVATGLTTTVWVGPPSACFATSIVAQTWYTNATPFPPDQIAGWSETVRTNDAAAGLSNVRRTEYVVITNGTSVALYDEGSELMYVSGELAASVTSVEIGGVDPYHIDAGELDVSKRSVAYFGTSAPHPSLYACASGYVSRVRVFALLDNSPVVPRASGVAIAPYFSANTPYVWTFNGAAVQGAKTGQGVVTVDATDPSYPSQTTDATLADAAGSEAGLGSSFEFSGLRLQLLGEYVNPTTQPQWNLGTTTEPTLEFDNGADWAYYDAQAEYDLEVPDQRSFVRAWNGYRGEVVRCAAIVVVTDWNWRHLGATVYTNTAWTPAWATANAP